MTATSEVRRVLVADVQVPFVTGGAELMVRGLLRQLRLHCEADLVTLPFRPEVKGSVLSQASAWRLVDLTSASGRPVDLVIATRFPSYFAKHPRKVAWVTHQHRAAYDLCGTPYSDFEHSEEDIAVRRQLIELDRRMLAECRGVFTIAQNTTARLKRFNGVDAETLYHPPPLADLLRPGSYKPYILVVSRLETVKRVDLAIRAMAHAPSTLSLVVVGDGSERRTLETLAQDLGVANRVTLVGAATNEEVAAYYADALAVLYAPYDEDYGYVTLEAFLARKPVVTASDSGGTLEFVVSDENGLVVAPDPEALGWALGTLSRTPGLAARLGASGRARASAITWAGVVERLLG